MKNLKIIALLFLSMSIVFLSCDKEEDTPTIKDEYFKIEGATFVNSNLPSASTSVDAPVIDDLYGNVYALAGGSNPISITTSASVKNILIGIEDEKGYFKITPDSKKSVSESYLIYLIMSQDFEVDNFTLVVAIVDDNGLVSSYEYIYISRVEAGTGKLQVSCSWDKANDVDLHLVEPDAEEIYYSYSYSTNGGDLDIDSNPGCYLDYVNNENITYGDDAVVETGEYIVRVDLYSNCDITGNTNYIVTARYNGELISPSVGTNPYYGYFLPENADYGGAGSGVQVMKFNIGSSKSENENSKVMNVFSFSYPEGKSNKPLNLSPFK